MLPYGTDGFFYVELRGLWCGTAGFLGWKGVDLLCGIDLLNWNAEKSQKVAIYWIIKINYLIFLFHDNVGVKSLFLDFFLLTKIIQTAFWRSNLDVRTWGFPNWLGHFLK